LPGWRYDRYFFAGMVVALLITAFADFAPTYYLAGLTSAKLPAPIVHVHAVLQSAWMLLLLAGPETFFVKSDLGSVTFVHDAKGQVTGYTYHRWDGQEIHAKKIK